MHVLRQRTVLSPRAWHNGPQKVKSLDNQHFIWSRGGEFCRDVTYWIFVAPKIHCLAPSRLLLFDLCSSHWSKIFSLPSLPLLLKSKTAAVIFTTKTLSSGSPKLHLSWRLLASGLHQCGMLNVLHSVVTLKQLKSGLEPCKLPSDARNEDRWRLTSGAASPAASFALSSCPSTSIDSASGSATAGSFSTKLALTTFSIPWIFKRTFTLILDDSPSLLGTTSLIENRPKWGNMLRRTSICFWFFFFFFLPRQCLILWSIRNWNFSFFLWFKNTSLGWDNVLINLLHPPSVCIISILLYTFLMVQTMRICLTIKSFFKRWSFPSLGSLVSQKKPQTEKIPQVDEFYLSPEYPLWPRKFSLEHHNWNTPLKIFCQQHLPMKPSFSGSCVFFE